MFWEARNGLFSSRESLILPGCSNGHSEKKGCGSTIKESAPVLAHMHGLKYVLSSSLVLFQNSTFLRLRVGIV